MCSSGRYFDPSSEDGIRPVADFVGILFGLDRYRERLAPDYPLRVGELSAGLPAALERLGAGSPFWRIG